MNGAMTGITCSWSIRHCNLKLSNVSWSLGQEQGLEPGRVLLLESVMGTLLESVMGTLLESVTVIAALRS